LLVGLAAGTLLVYELFIKTPVNLPDFANSLIRIMLITGFSLAIVFVINRSKQALTKHLGDQPATIVRYLMIAIALLIMVFAILDVIGVSPESLLAGAGITTITIGLIVSTFVSNILSGTFVLATHRLRVGDNVIVNNVPGEIIEVGTMVTRVKTDIGIISIPNSAIASGSVLITKITPYETASYNRLPYQKGDRVVTSIMEGEGTVIEITPLQTKVLLDSGKELIFLNSSVFAGQIAVAKVIQNKNPNQEMKSKSAAC
jgi:small-conductance mechanosensitive channel